MIMPSMEQASRALQRRFIVELQRRFGEGA
jgi:hypothetical protein